MEKVQKKMMAYFCMSIATVLLLVILFETNIFPTGVFTDSKSSEFVFLTMMEIVTLGAIPLALGLFKIKLIHAKLVERKEKALLLWGMLRLYLLAIPMLTNVLLYYFYMNVAFGYLGIMLFLCMFFVIPTMDRCQSDVEG